jgi:hypothetical protein
VSFLRAGAQDVADPVERVVAVTAVAQGVLLDAAADLVDDVGAELDHMEGVQHRGRVLKLVIDGVLVAVKRVQGRDLDPAREALAASLEPVAVGPPRAAGDQVEQTSPDASVLVTGQVDHAGELLRAPAAVLNRLRADVVPHVFIDAKSGDVVEA